MSKSDVIESLLTAALSYCAQVDLALLLEDAFRMHLVSTLLDAGHQVRVGAHQNGVDRILQRSSGQAVAWRDVKRSTRMGRFGDITIEDVGATIEFKVFGEVGPKDYPDKPGIRKDLGQLTARAADAAVVACSGQRYRELRKDSSTYKFSGAYPDPTTIQASFSDHTGLVWEAAQLKARAAKTSVTINGTSSERVVVALFNV